MRSWILGSAVLSLAFLPLSEPDDPPGAKAETLVLEPGKIVLQQLIEQAGRFLGKTYIYPPTPAEFTLQHRLEVGPDECEVLLSRLLYVHGLTLVPVDPERKIFEWIPLASPRRMEAKTSAVFVAPEQAGEGPKRVVLTQVALRNLDPAQASVTLRPLFTDPQGFSQIQVAGDSNSVLLLGFNDWVAQMVRMLIAVDAAAEEGATKTHKELASLRQAVKALSARVDALEKRGRD